MCDFTVNYGNMCEGKYECKICCFKGRDNVDVNRHLKSKKHIKNIVSLSNSNELDLTMQMEAENEKLKIQIQGKDELIESLKKQLETQKEIISKLLKQIQIQIQQFT
jgi:predicted transcriptional regulator